MPTPDSIAIIDAYTARRLWCDEHLFASASTTIISSPADASHRFNVIATRRTGAGCVVLVHDNLHDAIAGFAGRPADEVFANERITEAYAGRNIEIVLLAAQAYADSSDLRDPRISADIRRIERMDDPAWKTLETSADAEEWREGSMGEAAPPIFASFADGAIASVAHGIAADGVRKVGVYTSPQHRGRGHVKAAAYALCRHHMGAGAVMEWQARRSNTPSLGARDALGFIERYNTIMLRVT